MAEYLQSVNGHACQGILNDLLGGKLGENFLLSRSRREVARALFPDLGSEVAEALQQHARSVTLQQQISVLHESEPVFRMHLHVCEILQR